MTTTFNIIQRVRNHRKGGRRRPSVNNNIRQGANINKNIGITNATKEKTKTLIYLINDLLKLTNNKTNRFNRALASKLNELSNKKLKNLYDEPNHKKAIEKQMNLIKQVKNNMKKPSYNMTARAA